MSGQWMKRRTSSGIRAKTHQRFDDALPDQTVVFTRFVAVTAVVGSVGGTTSLCFALTVTALRGSIIRTAHADRRVKSETEVL